MRENIEIVEPSLEISKLQNEVITELSVVLPDSAIELIGSMAVPVSGKSEIDVMVISNNVDADSKLLYKKGYRQGPIVSGASYLSVKRNDISVDIQIIPTNHKMIEIHRKTLKKLRGNQELKDKYQKFKQSLAGLSGEEYKKRKSEWIKDNLLND